MVLCQFCQLLPVRIRWLAGQYFYECKLLYSSAGRHFIRNFSYDHIYRFRFEKGDGAECAVHYDPRIYKHRPVSFDTVHKDRSADADMRIPYDVPWIRHIKEQIAGRVRICLDVPGERFQTQQSEGSCMFFHRFSRSLFTMVCHR